MLIVTINGIDRTGKIRSGSLSIDDSLEGRGTCSFSISDRTMMFEIDVGQPLEVEYEGDLLFAGTIEEVRITYPEVPGLRVYKCKAVDWNQLCDRFYVNNVYENMTLKAIVEDIVNVQTFLSEEGITTGAVLEGPLIETAHFPYMKVTEAFKDLADLGGMSWNITPDKVLHFFERSTYEAPFTIGDFEKSYSDFEIESNRGQYRNKEILRAGYDTTALRTETFRGDAATTEPQARRRTFNLTFELASLTSIKVNGITIPANRIGIKGQDEDGIEKTDAGNPVDPNWKKWFYQVGKNEISQNRESDETLNPTLDSEDKLEVTYRGRFPMVIELQDDDEISSRAQVEGGTGIYEVVDKEEELDGRDLGVQKATRLLEIYGRIPRKITYTTRRHGLMPGHLQEVTIDELGLDQVEIMIDSIAIDFDETWIPVYRITALDGERQEGWADFFRDWYAAGRKATVRESEVVVLSRNFREQLVFTEAITESYHDAAVTLKVYTDDPYTVAWLGAVTVPVSGELVAACRVGFSKIGEAYIP